MNFNLAVVAGDGIGPEVMEQNINVLNAIGKKFVIHLIMNMF